MFCEKCGKEIPDSTKFCPYCGAAVSKAQDFVNKAGEVFNAAEQELGSAFDEVKQSFTGNSANQQNAGGQYNGGYQNNGAGQYNTGYQNNGGQTPPPYRGEKLKDDRGLASYIILSIITCGIYAWYWYYKLGNRLANNAGRYGLGIQENGTTVLMWCIFGTLICGIGPFIAMHILIKNSNMICNAYNRAHGLM